MYRVATHPRFEKEALAKLSPEELRRMDKLYVRVKQNPFIGDALGPERFREIRFGGKLIYFLIEGAVILFVDVSGKNDQQDVIDDVRANITSYTEYAKSATSR